MEVAINLNVKLSIVIATIGRDSLIQSIESIAYSCKLASETYEIIVVIDNPDVDSNLVIYLESVLQMDRLIINPVNLGAVKSFNIGLEKAKGELICVFSDDDLWLSNRSSDILNEFSQSPSLDILMTKALVSDEHGHLIRPKKSYLYKPFLETHYNWTFSIRNPTTFMMTSVIARKNVWSKLLFDETIVDHEDILWLHDAQKLGFNVKLLNKVTVSTRNSINRSVQRFEDEGDIWIKKLGEISHDIQAKYLWFHVPKYFFQTKDFVGFMKFMDRYNKVKKTSLQRSYLFIFTLFLFVISKF